MNAECAKIRASQETMSPGDGSDGHEIPELEQYDTVCEGTDESRMCADPHVPGSYEPGDDSEGYEILELEQYDRHSL